MASPTPNVEGDREDQQLLLPFTTKMPPSPGHELTERILPVCVWMIFSAVVVMFNKWLFTAGGFPYPLALTALHMTSCFVVFGAIRLFAPQKIQAVLMPDAKVEISWPVYFKNFVAISTLYACTLGAGNLAYLFGSVAFVTMLKPMNIIFVSLGAFFVGVEVPTFSHMIIVCIIAFGVAFSADHAATFSPAGLLLQILSSVSEGCRLSMVQVVTKGLKLDPVTTVYHFSGATALLLFGGSMAHEYPLDLTHLHSRWILGVNCAMAVILNVLVALVIKKTSAVVFTLSGIMKDICLVGASSSYFMTPVTLATLLGYSVSISGVCLFKAYKDNLTVFKEQGFVYGLRYVTATFIVLWRGHWS